MKILQLTYSTLLSLAMALMVHAESPSSTSATQEEPIIVGEVEPVGIVEAGTHFEARIDTGAETCSIHAENIEAFERDGKKWVRFQLINPTTKEPILLERPQVRRVKIKHQEGEFERRMVVKLRAAFGEEIRPTEFTLTDRSLYQYPLLVGRNLLHGTAIVDVSRKNTLEKPDLWATDTKDNAPKSSGGKN
ncbi:ATP-dependent zinc protease family protein [Sulfuriroseicoccus oceanibius]|uniref:ATP-dependent zinc protease n=1 Tax=Sulfuriroseicoccus oceanibius TaxID=2707525 RepID=A0A6B3LCF4_9BACT|nr:RimK/LysX family protein [Sulfuriroseicoccus oceanibius]QQL45969.1 ATP-dependent zinc protease [Sulfuriroseicoccus oceanibius]